MRIDSADSRPHNFVVRQRFAILLIGLIGCIEPAETALPPDVVVPDVEIEPEIEPEVDILAGITIAEPTHEGTYDRDDWPHWRDADHDCQDARDEVLIAESLVEVEFFNERQCDVTRGKWICPYTGKTFTGSGDLDIDHFVPLQNAHISGGWAWTQERRQAFANELADPTHLVAVEAAANRSKGSRGPDEWLPEIGVCNYVVTWTAIKRRWQLSMSEREAAAIRRIDSGCR